MVHIYNQYTQIQEDPMPLVKNKCRALLEGIFTATTDDFLKVIAHNLIKNYEACFEDSNIVNKMKLILVMQNVFLACTLLADDALFITRFEMVAEHIMKNAKFSFSKLNFIIKGLKSNFHPSIHDRLDRDFVSNLLNDAKKIAVANSSAKDSKDKNTKSNPDHKTATAAVGTAADTSKVDTKTDLYGLHGTLRTPLRRYAETRSTSFSDENNRHKERSINHLKIMLNLCLKDDNSNNRWHLLTTFIDASCIDAIQDSTGKQYQKTLAELFDKSLRQFDLQLPEAQELFNYIIAIFTALEVKNSGKLTPTELWEKCFNWLLDKDFFAEVLTKINPYIPWDLKAYRKYVESIRANTKTDTDVQKANLLTEIYNRQARSEMSDPPIDLLQKPQVKPSSNDIELNDLRALRLPTAALSASATAAPPTIPASTAFASTASNLAPPTKQSTFYGKGVKSNAKVSVTTAWSANAAIVQANVNPTAAASDSKHAMVDSDNKTNNKRLTKS